MNKIKKFDSNDFFLFVADSYQQNNLISVIIEYCEKYSFDLSLAAKAIQKNPKWADILLKEANSLNFLKKS